MKIKNIIILILFIVVAPTSFAAISVKDDAGFQLEFGKPAQRIISLTPHATELIFAAGAGDKLVGVSEFSDYPQEARSIPRIGSGNGLDMERIVAMQPDLIIGWQSGNRAVDIGKLKSLGLNVFLSEPRELEDIAGNIERLGKLAGSYDKATLAAGDFLMRYKRLRLANEGKKKVKVLYQIWHQPLMTINGEHLISKVIASCGGTNVYSDLGLLTPTVNLEDVIKRNPEVIIAGEANEKRSRWLEHWNKWPQIDAAKNRRVFHVPPDLLHRHTPRILDGMELVCKYLDSAR